MQKCRHCIRYVLSFPMLLISVFKQYASRLKSFFLKTFIGKFFFKIKQLFLKINYKTVLVLFILMQLSVCFYFAHTKQSFYCDEILTYGLANSKYGWVDKVSSTKFSENGWVTRDFFKNYITGDKSEPFSFEATYRNQEIDVHPPLHYALIHIASSFMDDLSKWPGISINLILLLLFDLAFLYVADYLYNDKTKAFYACALATLCSLGLGNILYIRMYFMMSVFLFLYTAIHVHILKHKKMSALDFFLLFVCVVLGGLTHYFFYIFAFCFSFPVCLYLLFKKNFWNLFWYVSVLLGGFVVNINIFPATLVHVLWTDRGMEAFARISHGIFWFGLCMHSINQGMLGENLEPLLEALVFLFACRFVMTFFKPGFWSKENLKQLISNVNVKMFGAIYVCFSAITFTMIVTWEHPRYLLHLYPFVALLFIPLFYWVGSLLTLDGWLKKALAGILIALCLSGSVKKYAGMYMYLYPDYPEARSKLERTKGYDALLFYDDGNVVEHYDSYPLKLLYDETFFFNLRDIDYLADIIKKRKTHDPLVIIIAEAVRDKFGILQYVTHLLGYRQWRQIASYRYMGFFELKYPNTK